MYFRLVYYIENNLNYIQIIIRNIKIKFDDEVR